MTLVLWLFELFYIFKGPSQSVSKSAFSRHLGFCDGGREDLSKVRFVESVFISRKFYQIPTPSKEISVKHYLPKMPAADYLASKV